MARPRDRRRDATARHELTLEKGAAAAALAQVQARLEAAEAAATERESATSNARTTAQTATERAQAAEASLARMREEVMQLQVSHHSRQREVDDANRRVEAWRDERVALQAELKAERSHVDYERRGREALEAELRTERETVVAMQVTAGAWLVRTRWAPIILTLPPK